MKHWNWLNLAEYGLLAGAGVGSVATAASQQILYTLAPMSGLFVLNLLNRQRLAEAAQAKSQASVIQLDQHVTDELAQLQQQVQVLPNFLDLASLRKSMLSNQQEQLNSIAAEIAQLRQEQSNSPWQSTQQDVLRLREQYGSITDSIGTIAQQLKHLQTTTQTVAHGETIEQAIAQLKSEVSHLNSALQTISDDQIQHSSRNFQDQINHLHRRLNKLPTPVDTTVLQQEVDALVKMMGEVPSRRELARLTMQVEQLSQNHRGLEQSVNPLKLATTILKKQLDTVSSRLTMTSSDAILSPTEAAILDDLKLSTLALETRLGELSLANSPELLSEIQSLVTRHLDPLQQQIAEMQHLTQTLNGQQQTLQATVDRTAPGFPAHLDIVAQHLDAAALHNELRALSARVEWTETNQSDLQQRVEQAIQDPSQIQRPDLPERSHLSDSSVPSGMTDYDLVFDVQPQDINAAPGIKTLGNRSRIEQALKTAIARLVIVYPYPQPQSFDSDLIDQFQAFLDRGGCLDLGWGHLGDLHNRRQSRSIHSRRAMDATENSYLHQVLHRLTELKQQYPERFRFKVLGTDEDFLVCDRTYAILGTPALSTASNVFPEASVGLRTRNAAVIQGLMERFDQPILAEQDAVAYFNRATTRYDLGDRPGAIADYDEVLRIAPDDDVTYNNRGLVRYDLGDKRGAMADFDLALQVNPGNFIAYCNRGVLRAELGDRVGAVEDYTAALEINPDYPIAYFYRGQALTKMQNRLGAIQDYSQVLRLNPQDATAHFYRGLACMRMGQRLEAVRDLRQAAQMFSDQGDLRSYQQVVDTLQKLHQRLGEAG